MVGLPDGEKMSKISLFVLAQFTNVTDGQTDTASQHRPPLCIAKTPYSCLRKHYYKLLLNIALIKYFMHDVMYAVKLCVKLQYG